MPSKFFQKRLPPYKDLMHRRDLWNDISSLMPSLMFSNLSEQNICWIGFLMGFLKVQNTGVDGKGTVANVVAGDMCCVP